MATLDEPGTKQYYIGGKLVTTDGYNYGRLTQAQIAAYAYAAGWRGEDLVKITAIAMRESSGYYGLRASSPNGTKEISYGLMMLNTLGNMGDWFITNVGIKTLDALRDPYTNLRAAKALYDKYGWRPWGPYKGLSETYNTNIPNARNAVAEAQRAGWLTPTFASSAARGAVPQTWKSYGSAARFSAPSAAGPAAAGAALGIGGASAASAGSAAANLGLSAIFGAPTAGAFLPLAGGVVGGVTLGKNGLPAGLDVSRFTTVDLEELGKLRPEFRVPLARLIHDAPGNAIHFMRGGGVHENTWDEFYRRHTLLGPGQSAGGRSSWVVYGKTYVLKAGMIPYAPPGRVPTHATGFAADLVIPKSVQDWMRRNVAAYGLEWGGTWNTPDVPHVQLANGNVLAKEAFALGFTGAKIGLAAAGMGGTAGGGTSGAGGAGADFGALGAAAGGDPAELYGWMSAFLDIPVVGNLIRQAAAEGWTPEKLQAQLMTTEWWKTTAQTAREWYARKATDPATATREIDQKAIEVQTVASTMGFTIDNARKREIAEAALALGWNEEEIRRAVGNETKRDPAKAAALAGSVYGQKLRDAVYQYAVPFGDEWITNTAQSVAGGWMTEDDALKQIRDAAISSFPTIADDLNRGRTVREVADPYVNQAAATLGIDPDQIDVTDPKWRAALDYVDPAGTRRMMNLYEWGDFLRQNPQYGYEFTPDAKSKAYAMVASLGQMFGRS